MGHSCSDSNDGSSSNLISIQTTSFFSLAGAMYHISTPDEELLEGGEPKGGVLVQREENLPHTSHVCERASSECLLRTMVDVKLKEKHRRIQMELLNPSFYTT
jgi:hypothetical protein